MVPEAALRLSPTVVQVEHHLEVHVESDDVLAVELPQ